jgi:hypothetical protein
MSKFIIYGAGLVVVAFVVGLLLFLTFDNAASGQAIYGNRLGIFSVSGPASVLVNIGIVSLVLSFVSYVAYLFSRSPLLLKSYKFIGAASGVFIFIGLAWGQA